MKKTSSFFALLILSTSLAFSGITGVDPVTNDGTPIERNILVSSSETYQDNAIHIELTMLNELEEGVYALKREFEDGRFETVQLNKIIPNAGNIPVVHNFEDKAVPNEDFTYLLIRIYPQTKKFEVVKRWSYYSDRKEIWTEGVLASN
ncbi:MAG: hypothetical protein JKY09_04550 [Crocinitomicaceae bacterium]|nr:hypothetical protein [Crocinitomicaceae bacterium]